MGIEVSDKERLELLKSLPVDGELHLGYCDLQSIEFYGSSYDVYTLKCHMFIFTCPPPHSSCFLMNSVSISVCQLKDRDQLSKESSSKKSVLRR